MMMLIYHGMTVKMMGMLGMRARKTNAPNVKMETMILIGKGR